MKPPSPSSDTTSWNGAQGMIRPFEGELGFARRLVDVICVPAGLFAAVVATGHAWDSGYTHLALLASVLFYLVGQGVGLYRFDRGRGFGWEFGRVWFTWGSVFMLMLFVAFMTKTSAEHSRRLAMTWLVVTPSLISFWRLVMWLGANELRARGYNSRSAAIVGMSPVGLQMHERMKHAPEMGIRVNGFYDDRALARLSPSEQAEQLLLGGFDDLLESARRGDVDIVYIALPPRAENRTVELIRRLADTTASVYIAYDFGGFDLLNAQWSNVGEVPVMSVVEQPFYGSDALLKRVEDVVLGGLILALIAIPMLIISIGVKLSSPGPIFFRQRRYGLNGEEISVLKFRSMTVCEDGDRVVQATQGDKRVTPFGAFIRRTSLDELPQFLNVLTGEMSIVGPRPHAVAHNEQYRSRIQGYMLRHKVKPGITGWAQVNGWRGETDTLEKMEKRVEHDLDYIRNWAVLFDLRIIAMTVLQVVRQRNAY